MKCRNRKNIHHFGHFPIFLKHHRSAVAVFQLLWYWSWFCFLANMMGGAKESETVGKPNSWSFSDSNDPLISLDSHRKERDFTVNIIWCSKSECAVFEIKVQALLANFRTWGCVVLREIDLKCRKMVNVATFNISINIDQICEKNWHKVPRHHTWQQVVGNHTLLSYPHTSPNHVEYYPHQKIIPPNLYWKLCTRFHNFCCLELAQGLQNCYSTSCDSAKLFYCWVLTAQTWVDLTKQSCEISENIQHSHFWWNVYTKSHSSNQQPIWNVCR